jgi:hypothetical protein
LTTRVEATDGSGGRPGGLLAFEDWRGQFRVAHGLRRPEEMRLRFVSAVVSIATMLLPFTRSAGSVKEMGPVPQEGDRSMKQLAKLTVYI